MTRVATAIADTLALVNTVRCAFLDATPGDTIAFNTGQVAGLRNTRSASPADLM